jgi:hypothetical protein
MKSKSLWGYALMGLGFLFCPCHLPITLPLLAAWLSGTALTSFLNVNLGLITVASTALFIGLFGFGWWLLSRQEACAPKLGNNSNSKGL